MKSIITCLLSLSFLPIALPAQPVLTSNEFYYTGDVIQMVNCNISGVSAGSAGAGMEWDFSSLTASGGMSTTSVLHDTSMIFSTSSLMEILPNGSVAFVQQGSSKTYINGLYDPGTGSTIYYDDYIVSNRPITYNTNFIDSYYVNIPATSTFGTGTLTHTGDAYGTLILPTATYSNVLRVRKVQQENDTTGSSAILTTTVSYLWFDTGTAAPLLRIDSISNSATQTQDVMYLSSLTNGITDINKHQYVYSGYFDNAGDLVLSGFELDKSYTVVVYNIIGSKVFVSDFSAADNSLRFNMARPLNPGIYLVNITMKNEQSAAPGVIKIVKDR